VVPLFSDTSVAHDLIMPFVHRLLRARRSRVPLVRRAALEALALCGVDWPESVVYGPGLRLPPGRPAVVVHPCTTIGRDVTIGRGVTVGDAVPWLHAHHDRRLRVEIGDGVVLGDAAVVIGRPDRPTVVGRGTVVRPGAVLTCSTGPDEVWAGNPARRVGSADGVVDEGTGADVRRP
jgi:serine O-acetyltransferase